MSHRIKTLAIACFIAVLAGIPALAQQAGLTAELDALARELAEADAAPGVSVAVVRGADTLLLAGYGYADVENEVPATARTIYRIGSITKQFTASAVMQLVEQGKLSLDDPLTDFVEDYPEAGRRVTIHHLLNHTSGIVSYTGKSAFWEQSRLDLSHEQLLALFKDEPLEFEPGAGYAYNNSAYYLLGMVLEHVAGKPYGVYLAETFFEPLGLGATSYCHNQPIIPHRADGYDLEDGELVNAAPLSMGPPFSAGALCSSVVDLMRWQRALVDGRVVSPESYRLMTTPTKLSDGTEQGYGYGLGVVEVEGTRRVAHGGGINGFITFLSYYPEHDLSIAVLTNSGQGNPDQIERRLMRKVLGIPEPVYTEVDLAPEVLERYVGVYELAPTFKITVTREGGQLRAQATGQDAIDIFPMAEAEFFLKAVDAQLSFEVDDQGVAQGLTLHQNGRDTPGKKVE